MAVQFFVPGVPVPKGSAKAFMRKGARFPVVMQDNAEKQKPWASMVGLCAQSAGAQRIGGSVCLKMSFYFPRPKSHFRKNGVDFRPSAPATHVTKPDLDKLVRCVMDALTGIAYTDDSQVIELHLHKTFADERQAAGARVIVEEV